MKTILVRESGKPVDLAHEPLVEAAVNQAFDKGEARWGVTQESALKMQRYLRFCERSWKALYPAQVEIKMPASAKAMAALSDKYEAPLQIGKTVSGVLLIIVQDESKGA